MKYIKIGSNNAISFEEVYQTYFNDVYGFVFSLSRNQKVAEEITQETFYKALEKIDTYRGECRLSVWLCQIAKNTYYTYYRKNQRFGDFSQDEVDQFDLTGYMEDKELVKSLHQVLHQLAEPYKEVFTLRIFGELSFRQIAELFGHSESWARVTFYRAKKKIRERLG